MHLLLHFCWSVSELGTWQKLRCETVMLNFGRTSYKILLGDVKRRTHRWTSPTVLDGTTVLTQMLKIISTFQPWSLCFYWGNHKSPYMSLWTPTVEGVIVLFSLTTSVLTDKCNKPALSIHLVLTAMLAIADARDGQTNSAGCISITFLWILINFKLTKWKFCTEMWGLSA